MASTPTITRVLFIKRVFSEYWGLTILQRSLGRRQPCDGNAEGEQLT